MDEWHLVFSLDDFEKLREKLDKETDDLVRWNRCAFPSELPCLAFAQDRYMGGAYDGYFIFCYRRQAAFLVGGLALPLGNVPD